MLVDRTEHRICSRGPGQRSSAGGVRGPRDKVVTILLVGLPGQSRLRDLMMWVHLEGAGVVQSMTPIVVSERPVAESVAHSSTQQSPEVGYLRRRGRMDLATKKDPFRTHPTWIPSTRCRLGAGSERTAGRT